MNAFPDYISNKLITIDDKDPSWMNDEIKNKIKKRDIRLWHMRHAITHTPLHTPKTLETSKKKHALFD